MRKRRKILTPLRERAITIHLAWLVGLPTGYRKAARKKKIKARRAKNTPMTI